MDDSLLGLLDLGSSLLDLLRGGGSGFRCLLDLLLDLDLYSLLWYSLLRSSRGRSCLLDGFRRGGGCAYIPILVSSVPGDPQRVRLTSLGCCSSFQLEEVLSNSDRLLLLCEQFRNVSGFGCVDSDVNLNAVPTMSQRSCTLVSRSARAHLVRLNRSDLLVKLDVISLLLQPLLECPLRDGLGHRWYLDDLGFCKQHLP